MTGFEIQHDRGAHRFFTVVDGKEAYLAYAVADDGTLDFRHTFVPPELRGRELARLLVAAAFAYAQEGGFKVIPTCSYVAKQAQRNDAYRTLIAE